MRYFALKNGFFSRECQIDKSKLQKLQENKITEQKGKKYVIWIIFALWDHFWANFGQFFGWKYRRVGCPEQCHVTRGIQF